MSDQPSDEGDPFAESRVLPGRCTQVGVPEKRAERPLTGDVLHAVDLANRSDFGCGAGEKHLVGTKELFARECTNLDGNVLRLGELQNAVACDAGNNRAHFVVGVELFPAYEKDVLAGGARDRSVVVQKNRIVEPTIERFMRRQNAVRIMTA